MLRMILRRLMLGLITVGLVSVIIFAAVEVLPGDACTAVLKQDAQGQRLINCRLELGLDRPAPLRYLDWASAAVRGDLGAERNQQQGSTHPQGDHSSYTYHHHERRNHRHDCIC